MKGLSLFVVALLSLNALFAQFPTFDAHSVSDITAVYFRDSRSRNKGKIKTEVPPWIIAGGLKSYFFVDGSDTYIWSSASPLTANRTINLRKEAFGPYNASTSYIRSPEYDAAQPTQHWKRTYHAIYSAEYFRHPAAGTVSIGFLHSENKNLVSGNRHYPNTIQPNVPINMADHNSYSGGQPFIEGWNAYNALVTAAWIPNNLQTNWGQEQFRNEMGPIVWPATGYITSEGVKCTSGLKHPSSIIAGDYMYVFYSEGGPFGNAIPDEEGRREGIKVARAPLSDALNPQSYEVYYKAPDGQEFWQRSLPEGFTKENMLQFVTVKGAKATDIMNDDERVSQEIRFSVAKVRNTDYYIGVEEYIDIADAKKFKVALRFSADLVHWSNRVFSVSEARDWDATRLNYPIFLSKDGWSNTEVDINDFYILGTEPGVKDHVNKIHFRVPPQVIIPPPNARGPLWQDHIILPNPNNGFFRLLYTVDTLSHVEINMYNLSGQHIQSIRVQKKPGRYIEDFDIHSYPAGIYLVAIRVNNRHHVYKVVKG